MTGIQQTKKELETKILNLITEFQANHRDLKIKDISLNTRDLRSGFEVYSISVEVSIRDYN
jgi:hypothetical protein